MELLQMLCGLLYYTIDAAGSYTIVVIRIIIAEYFNTYYAQMKNIMHRWSLRD